MPFNNRHVLTKSYPVRCYFESSSIGDEINGMKADILSRIFRQCDSIYMYLCETNQYSQMLRFAKMCALCLRISDSHKLCENDFELLATWIELQDHRNKLDELEECLEHVLQY